MGISLVIGKPGSGKSYFAVSKIAESLRDWCEYERRENQPYNRCIYTNLPLILDAINEHVSNEMAVTVDCSHYIQLLEDSFFYDRTEDGGRLPITWWESFPNNAFIIIDEVHTYIPSGGGGGRDYMQLFTEYVATHRHRKHDIILITQHTDTIHKNILCMAADAYHVVNIKNRVIPWVNIPLADFDVIKESFGIKRQIANIVYGNYLSRAFRMENQYTIVLKPEIFRLYTSNTLSQGEEAGDRPSLKMGPVRAIFWFIRKHFLHLTFKAILIYGIFWGIRYVLTVFPTKFSETLLPNNNVLLVDESKKVDKVQAVAPPPTAPVVAPVQAYPYQGRALPESDSEVEEPAKITKKESMETDFVNQNGIYVYGNGYIVTREEGRVNVGEDFIYKGELSRLQVVDVLNRRVLCVPCASFRVPGAPVAED